MSPRRFASICLALMARNPQTLDAVTNYECYKGLPLYAFADNHDVSRVASILRERAHLLPLYCLLFTMPGVPSIYYGSEWRIEGRKQNGLDWPLRPHLDLGEIQRRNGDGELAKAIARLAQVRHASPALRHGDYGQLEVRSEQLVFVRQAEGETVIVAVSGADKSALFDLEVPTGHEGTLVDLLNPGERFAIRGGRVQVEVWPCWARVLRVTI